MLESEVVLNDDLGKKLDRFMTGTQFGRDILSSPQATDCMVTHLRDVQKFLPDLRTGGYIADIKYEEDLLTEKYIINPEKFVPSPELASYLLFAGCKDVGELRKYVFDEVDALGRDFHIQDKIFGINEHDMETVNIKKALLVVEHAMQGIKRRTGEDGFAHILRGVKRGVDFIRNVVDKKDVGEFTLPFSSLMAETLLVGIALHDLGEEDREVNIDGLVNADGLPVTAKRKIGEVVPYFSLPSDFGVLARSFGHGVDSDFAIKLQMDEKMIVPLLSALHAVDRSNVLEEETIRHLLQSIANLYSLNDINLFRQYFVSFLAVVMKDIDILDNVSTHTYRWDKVARKFVAHNPIKVIKKANDVLNQFKPIEQIISTFFTPISGKRGVGRIIYGKPLPRWFNDETALSYMPSHWAVKTLMGYGPDDIFSIDHLKKENKKGLPRLI